MSVNFNNFLNISFFFFYLDNLDSLEECCAYGLSYAGECGENKVKDNQEFNT